MTATALNDCRRARLAMNDAVLLLIDVQIGPLWELEFARLRQNLIALSNAAISRSVPTVATTIAEEQWGPMISEIAVATSPIARTVVNAWDDPRIRDLVEASGRGQLIIAGGAPEFSVAPCAVAAVDAGYDVFAAIDASALADRRDVVRMFRAGVTVADPALLLAECMGATVYGHGLGSNASANQRLAGGKVGGHHRRCLEPALIDIHTLDQAHPSE